MSFLQKNHRKTHVQAARLKDGNLSADKKAFSVKGLSKCHAGFNFSVE
jgi:hypothetical protein